MDEQRFKAYISLIEQLLGCPQEQVMEILQARAELVDAELLVVMELVAYYLESQGNSNANWLRGFAAQLAQVLKGDIGSKTAEGAETEDSVQFLLETLQLVWDSQGNSQQVYPFWAQQQARFNSALLEVLPQVVAMLYEQNAEHRTSIAFALGEFSILIQQFPLGIRWLKLELSIAADEQALQIYTREAFPVDWATTQNNLANAYLHRIRGERADNLEQAIAAYEQALQVYTREAFPVDWAGIQNNLANAYLHRIRGERADNLEQAIAVYEQALQVRTREAFPKQWARIQNNLATAYSERIRGERADNLEQAIAACKQALQIFTRGAFPVDWAMMQIHLMLVYSWRIQGDRADNLKQAITACQLALQVYTHEAFPEQWWVLQKTLSSLGSRLVRVGQWQEGLELLLNTLQQIRQDDDVFAHATALFEVGYAYEMLSDLDNARLYYRDALRLYEHIDNQAGVAYSRAALGSVLVSLGHLQKGIAELGTALELYAQLQLPDQITEIDGIYQAAQRILERQATEAR